MCWGGAGRGDSFPAKRQGREEMPQGGDGMEGEPQREGRHLPPGKGRAASAH